MRKEDRIRQQQSQAPEQQRKEPQPRADDRMKSSASDDANRPPRQASKLPLPD